MMIRKSFSRGTRRLWVMLALALVVSLATLAAACGGGGDEEKEEVEAAIQAAFDA